MYPKVLKNTKRNGDSERDYEKSEKDMTRMKLFRFKEMTVDAIERKV